MQITVILAFGILVVLQAFGDVVSAKTNGRLPSLFVSAVLFLIGFWTVVPASITTIVGGKEVTQTLLSLSGITGSLFTVLLTLLVTNMGSLMTIKELMKQWKTVIIGLGGILGVMIFAYFIGGIIFGREYGIVVAPPLAGGLAAMDIMARAAKTVGREDLAIIAALVFSTQGLLGYPLMGFFLRRQSKKIMEQYRAGKIKLQATDNSIETLKSRFKIIPDFPEEYQTPTIMIAKVAFVSFLAEQASKLTGGAVHTYVMCLVLGIIASEIGFLEKKIFSKSETMGLLMVLLMGFVFGGLASVTIEQLIAMMIPLFGTMLIGTAGIILFGIIIGRLFHETWEMSAAIAINCLLGFPPNYILTVEASKAMSSNKEEYNILMDQMLPKVLVGGFATVTVASVLVANLFASLL